MIIATRILTLRGEAGDTDVPIRIHAPVRDHLGVGCKFEIEWPGRRKAFTVHGEDEVQAIALALQAIGAQIYASEEHKAGKLGWGEPGNGYGFPVTKNMRDRLVGYDKQFYGE
jgi:hypothetical protein